MDVPPLRATPWLLVLAGVFVALELIPNFFGEYGIFIDEFYYVACSERPALGYVDHPPLSAWILQLSRLVFGESQLGLRVLPALTGGACVVLTGLLAWRLGAGTFGQLLAGLALACAPIPELLFGFYSMNPFEILLWTAGAYVLVERVRTGDDRYWLVFGVVAGIGLLNKHTFLLFGVGLLAGLLLTKMRRELLNRRLWAGVALAAMILLPNVLWQVENGWPSLEFYRNADQLKNVSTPAPEVFLQQVLFMNPIGAFVWGAGVVFLLTSARGRPWRHLGWLFLVLFVLTVASQKSRPDRIAGAYPLVLAAGAVSWEGLSRRARWRWTRYVLPFLLVASSVAFAPIAFPILRPGLLAEYSAALGIVPQIEKGKGGRGEVPQWMADRLGWQEFVDEIARVVESELDPEEHERALVLVPSYGHAGALELLGRDLGLPRVAGTQNTYHLWGIGDDPVEVLVSVGYGPQTLGGLFESVALVSTIPCDYCPAWRDGLEVYVARGAKAQLSEYWEEFKHYE